MQRAPPVIQGKQKKEGQHVEFTPPPFEMKRNEGQRVGSRCLPIEMERNRGGDSRAPFEMKRNGKEQGRFTRPRSKQKETERNRGGDSCAPVRNEKKWVAVCGIHAAPVVTQINGGGVLDSHRPHR